jgi:hypothetical protein
VPGEEPRPTDERETNERRRRLRSLAIAWALGAFVILLFAVTIVKLSGYASHP